MTITPSAAAGVRPAGVPYNIVLNDGQTYQLRSTGFAPADLSGTLISSTAPIAVFGGHQCATIPDGGTCCCDHVVEQLPPTTTWGKAFVTMPLATRTFGDWFRVLASANNTGVSINGVLVATLNRGQFHEQIITGPARITTSEPVLVAQYSNSSQFDLVTTSDPFEMLVPPFEEFLASYTVTTPASGFAINFINLVVPNAAVGSVTLDGVLIPSAAYVPIAGTTFSGTQRSVTVGTHNVAGPLPFCTFVYGFAHFDSYGYPGGMSLSQVAVVTSLTLAPKTASNPVNTQHCVNATLKYQNNAPVSGVRVDFAVTGVNANAGFANADVAGVAQFCYTGTAAGIDSIVASVGTLSDTASKTWTAVIRACDVDSDSDIDSNDIRAITRLRGQAVPPAPAAADYDNNKYININDARGCTLICTRPSCATN